MKRRTHYSYCIFYLDNKYYKDINKHLRDYGYHKIRAIVPTVKFIKRISSRGSDIYQEEPILFNYGFMKLPTSIAFNRVLLNKMRKEIPGIKGWLKDTETLHRRRGKKRRVENSEDFDDFSKVAMVPYKVVRRLIELSHVNSYIDYDSILSTLNEGKYIRLSCYPYIGADAIVEKVDIEKNRIRLHLYPTKYKEKISVWLPLDMIIYNIYQDYNPRIPLADQRYNLDSFPNNYMEGYIRKKKHKRCKIKEQ